MVKEVFDGRIKGSRFNDFFDELYDIFARPGTWRLFSDSLSTLRGLKQLGLVVGIVSNWDSRLFRLCDGLGVSRHVDFVLASAVVGTAKPGRRIFSEALRLARVTPGEAVHVGDSFTEDYWGARRMGLRALLVCRHPKPPSNAVVIKRLSDVMKFIAVK